MNSEILNRRETFFATSQIFACRTDFEKSLFFAPWTDKNKEVNREDTHKNVYKKKVHLKSYIATEKGRINDIKKIIFLITINVISSGYMYLSCYLKEWN